MRRLFAGPMCTTITSISGLCSTPWTRASPAWRRISFSWRTSSAWPMSPTTSRRDRTLQSLYLRPLQARQEQGGRVYRDGPRCLLLIDIKTAAEPTYRKLHEILASTGTCSPRSGPPARREGPFSVIVSGNRPLELMRSQEVRYAGYDGRLTDLDSDLPADVIPMISDNGVGTSPGAARGRCRPTNAETRTRSCASRMRRAGWCGSGRRRIRMSAAREAVWQELLSAGVDLINTDDLEGLRRFLLEHGR